MVVQLLAAGVAGVALGAISVLLGYAEMRHRNRLAGHEPTVTDELGTRTTPIRW
jgi:hypothetical protein